MIHKFSMNGYNIVLDLSLIHIFTHRYKSIIVIDTIICQSKGGEFFVKPLLNYMCIYTIIRYKIGIFIYGFNLKFESI